MMNRKVQIIVSLVVLFLGTVALTFGVTRFWVWKDCDARYIELANQINTDEELKLYFRSKGQNQYFIRLMTFRPSGRKHSGSGDSIPSIVGGGAVVLLSAFGLWDTLRQQKETPK
jgi:hypothetical protein